MSAVAKFLLNITLITVISVVLRIIVSYYPDYDARDFDWGIFPYIITGLFFLAAFLNPEGSLCRKGDLIIGIIALVLSIIISFIYYQLNHMSCANQIIIYGNGLSFFKEDKANAVLLVIACLLLCFLLYKVAGIKIRFNKKEPRTVFSWSPSVSTPYNYPVELLRCKVGFGDEGKSFPVFDSYPILGIGESGAGGVDLNAFDIERGFPIPNSIDILWVAYTEKKFYKADIKFSEELQYRILELFREGYYGVKQNQRFRYNNLVITLLPEGKIWLYLDGLIVMFVWIILYRQKKLKWN